MGIPRHHLPGQLYPRLQYLTSVGELVWGTGYPALQFCVHTRGISFPLGIYFFYLLAVDKLKDGDIPFVLPDKRELGGAH